MLTAALIPARFASTRLPGKPLLDQTGVPLVCHVIDQASKAGSIDQILVATDDSRIAQAVRRHGGEAVMTRAEHPNGASRIAEAARSLPAPPHGADAIVNVQGDEPEIDPILIDHLVERLRSGGEPMATLASPFSADEDPANPDIVKVVVDQRGRALYFSRSRIPFHRDASFREGAIPLKHAGLYAYRRTFLEQYVHMPSTPAERAEKLEQLRVLEHGHPIGVLQARVEHHGIDTPEQYEAFVERWKQRRG